MPTHLTSEQKAQIVDLRCAGLSFSKIGLQLGINKSKVQMALQIYNSTGSFLRKEGSGRPRKVSAAGERMLL